MINPSEFYVLLGNPCVCVGFFSDERVLIKLRLKILFNPVSLGLAAQRYSTVVPRRLDGAILPMHCASQSGSELLRIIVRDTFPSFRFEHTLRVFAYVIFDITVSFNDGTVFWHIFRVIEFFCSNNTVKRKTFYKNIFRIS